MRYDGTNLKQVLEAHKRWLEEGEGWTEADRADLRRANLRRADLRGANLFGADLHEADLFRADLREAVLCEADLREAYLFEANLSGADLYKADLREADLEGANLKETCLHDASLYGVDLHKAINIPFIPMACPDTGAFIGWKKIRVQHGYGNYAIAMLLIPWDAKRSSATTRKCRAEHVVVLELQELDGTPLPDEVEGCSLKMCDPPVIYRKHERVTADKWDKNRWNECSHGIHFFVNRQEAVNYR